VVEERERWGESGQEGLVAKEREGGEGAVRVSEGREEGGGGGGGGGEGRVVKMGWGGGGSGAEKR